MTNVFFFAPSLVPHLVEMYMYTEGEIPSIGYVTFVLSGMCWYIQGRHRKGKKFGMAGGSGNHPHHPGEGVGLGGGAPLPTSQGVWGVLLASPPGPGAEPEKPTDALCRKN